MAIDKKQKSYRLGLFAELVATIYLNCCFYRILKHRYQPGTGEIDIIAKRGKQIIFLEVKARKNKHEDIHYALTTHQQNRIRRSAEIFMARHRRYANNYSRFDLFLFGGLFKMKYIKDAF